MFLQSHVLLANTALGLTGTAVGLAHHFHIRMIPIDRISSLFCFFKRVFDWEETLSLVMP